MNELRHRQVHLDFHTAGNIKDIGKRFDKNQFQQALQRGHIDSITVFAKCVHGWSYYPSRLNEMHPHLDFDLLQAQIDACHEIGIKAPVYISAGMDDKLARVHTEWLHRKPDESTSWVPNFNQPGYHVFCFNSPFLDLLVEQVEEVVRDYDVDGIFLDVAKPMACYCQNCIKARLDTGKDPYSPEAARELAEEIHEKYTSRIRSAIDSIKPGLALFHNGGHIAKGRHDLVQMNTHLELESLPTGEWGYDHFPMSAKYLIHEGMDFLGQTGKFHTAWGEFGGFKHPNALIYETSQNLALGAKCSIGDQLHPLGFMDELTYENIGQAYALVEQKEKWCKEVQPISDIAFLSMDALDKDSKIDQHNTYPMDIGAYRLLTKEHYLFDIIDDEMDFTKYKVVILPDEVQVNNQLKEKLINYVNLGGKLLVTGKSGLKSDGSGFNLDLGIKWVSSSTNYPNYYVDSIDDNASPHIMYSESEVVELTSGEALSGMQKTYFNRSTFEFCSHLHAPSTMEISSPGMVATPSTIYIPWKVFTEYYKVGSLHLRKIVRKALDYLLDGQELIRCNLPSQGTVSYMKQEKENRNVLHLLYGSPVLRGVNPADGRNIEVIEDLPTIINTEVSLKVNEEVKRVYLAPQNINLDYKQIDGRVEFTVDQFTCHQMVVVDM